MELTPRIALTSLEGMEALAYPLSPVRRFRVTENSQPVPYLACGKLPFTSGNPARKMASGW